MRPTELLRQPWSEAMDADETSVPQDACEGSRWARVYPRGLAGRLVGAVGWIPWRERSAPTESWGRSG